MELKDWITGGAAVIAAVIGIVNLVVQLRDRGEKLLVKEGTRQPAVHQYTSFYVVNLGKHDVEISDYGFLLFSGELLSIPYKIEVSEPPHDDIDVYGFKELKLAPRGHAEAGMEIRGRVAGYYVLSTTGNRPVICFADVGIFKKLMLRWRLIGKLKFT